MISFNFAAPEADSKKSSVELPNDESHVFFFLSLKKRKIPTLWVATEVEQRYISRAIKIKHYYVRQAGSNKSKI